MPVDFIHLVIGLLFVVLWGVISQFSLSHDAAARRRKHAGHHSPLGPHRR